jgi:hypothetical protein
VGHGANRRPDLTREADVIAATPKSMFDCGVTFRLQRSGKYLGMPKDASDCVTPPSACLVDPASS